MQGKGYVGGGSDWESRVFLGSKGIVQVFFWFMREVPWDVKEKDEEMREFFGRFLGYLWEGY